MILPALPVTALLLRSSDSIILAGQFREPLKLHTKLRFLLGGLKIGFSKWPVSNRYDDTQSAYLKGVWAIRQQAHLSVLRT